MLTQALSIDKINLKYTVCYQEDSRRYFFLGQLAQQVERQTEDLRVGGSIPSLSTMVR